MKRQELVDLKKCLQSSSDILRVAVKESDGDAMMSAAYRAWKAIQTAAKITNEELSQLNLPEATQVTVHKLA